MKHVANPQRNKTCGITFLGGHRDFAAAVRGIVSGFLFPNSLGKNPV